MREELNYRARRIFAEMRQAFDEEQGAEGWWHEFTEENVAAMGMTAQQFDGGATFLIKKGLLKRMGMDGLQLDDDGYQACVFPELLDEYLGPPRSLGVGLNVTAQNFVIGDNNTLQVNSDEVIAKLIAHLTADAAIEPEKKKRWLEVLKDVGGHIAAEGLKVVIDRALGK